MEAIAIVTALAVLQLFFFAFKVGVERGKHGVEAPATTGHPDFERAFRVHQNSVEQLVIFLPGLWIFGYYIDPLIGAGIGVLFIVSRFVYRVSYLRDPKTRATGAALSAFSTITLVLGGVVGAVLAMT